VFAVTPDMKDVLNGAISVAVCGPMVMVSPPLPVIVNPPPSPPMITTGAVEPALAELAVDSPGITIPFSG